ncbi:DUF1285 domain-containing protein [Kaistia algarum]|uniref:DUF1285 domain-containing protein n=1 Tax=Kaistia algarum TaxID=2083279 RepID=UPI000CE82D2F|nr:DUF1285 domain-containing protein [Kaistia algarum]MCX5515612.1 DUF1285 domain-containing protein [Kaistia algarum]PPE80997.1 DUF1285 domain-containing protein [Kaistia algarum]
MPVSKEGETKAETEFGPVSYLARWAAAVEGGTSGAPVHLWNPALCSSIDIRIDRAGAWYHEGRRIEREAMTRLFARILRREADGSYVLVTPYEKLTIEVEDVPFLAVDLGYEEGPPRRLLILTNLGEAVPVDADHPLRIQVGARDDAFIPYVMVRPRLEARLTRAAAASLVGILEERDDRLGVESAGQFFVIAESHPAGRS